MKPKVLTYLYDTRTHQVSMLFFNPMQSSKCVHIANGPEFGWVRSQADDPLRQLEGLQMKTGVQRIDGLDWGGGQTDGICYKTPNLTTTHVIVQLDIVKDRHDLIITIHQGGVSCLEWILSELTGDAELGCA